MLCIFIVFGRPQDFFSVLIPLRPALCSIVLALLTTFFTKRKFTLKEVLLTKEGRIYALFYLFMILSIPFAYHRREAFILVFQDYLANILFFCVFVVQVDSLKNLKKSIFVLCFSTLWYVVLSLMNGFISFGRFYSGAEMYDPNDLAYFIVSLFPISIYYIVHKQGLLLKLFALVIVISSISAILLSASRGGLLGLVAVVGLLLFTPLGGLKMWWKILITVFIIMIFAKYNINIDRFTTLRNISSDYNVTDEFGRIDIWKKGIKLIGSHPIFGVGASCFSMAIGEMRAAANEIPVWQVAHNSYIQIGAEIGLVGFGLFASLIYISMKNFYDCRKNSGNALDSNEYNKVAGLLLIGYIGHLISAFFLTQGYSNLFTLYFAFSSTLRKLKSKLDKNIEGIRFGLRD